MGKTVSGAVWLDPEKTSPYEFYQYWRNVADADVLKCIRMLTFLPLEQIDEMDKWEGAQLNRAKEILAFELTKMVHGEEEAKKAEETAKAIFTSGDAANMAAVKLEDDAFTDGSIDIVSLIHAAGLAATKSEARRVVSQEAEQSLSERNISVTSLRKSRCLPHSLRTSGLLRPSSLSQQTSPIRFRNWWTFRRS